MRKTIKKTVATVLALGMGLSLMPMTACKKGSANDESTCEVKAVIAGYATDWLVEAADVFNDMYEDEGYSVEISLMDTDVGMAMEMTTPKRNTTDLYFEWTGSIDNLIEKSRSILGADGGALLEDLSDVLSSSAINKNKQSVGGAIEERIDPTHVDLSRYKGSFSGFDGVYGMPWYGGTAGIYVNKKVLAEKGYTFDAFLTTDSMIEMTEALAPKGDARLNRNSFFPVTWTGMSSGYWDYWIQSLIAQYMGFDTYKDFWDFIPAGGEEAMIESGYTVYENRGIYEALKVAETLENRDYAVPGTAGMNHIEAQARLFEGSSLYMVTGDWVYKEMELNYGDKLDDVIAVKNPVVSALGVKLGLCGTTHEEPAFDTDNFVADYSCAACETKLRAIIKAVDANAKTDAQIASDVGVTEEQVATVRERRGYYQANTGFSAMIPSYSNAKDVAKLFLRFLCSDDGIDIYTKNTYSNFIVERITPIDSSTLSDREKAVYDMMYTGKTTPFFTKSNNPIRVVTSSSVFPAAGTTKLAYLNLSYSHIDTKNPVYTAKSTFFDNVLIAKGNWADWVATAGLN